MIAPDGQSFLIDYGDVDDGPASLDPVTLELSLIFHIDGPLKGPWPTLEQARQWANLDAYLNKCPAADFIRECRKWAINVAAGDREIAASTYIYLLRQLKYSDTNKDLARELSNGIQKFYKST